MLTKRASHSRRVLQLISVLDRRWGQYKGAIVTRYRVVRIDRLAMCRAACVLVLAVLGVFVFERAWAASSECATGLTQEDTAGVRAVVEAYRTAWLKGDAQGVLNTLTADAVLLPAHGARPIVGKEAITKYWWPAGAPASQVTKLDITVEGLAGDCLIAYAYGHDDVAWTQEEKGISKAHGHPGTYLNVFRRSADGTWRISHHMWDDGRTDR
jgi:uncharacterized protein (TIGR02246 family)